MGTAPPRPARSGHVIVCGLQGIGLRTVEHLHLAGVEVVAVDDEGDPRLHRALDHWGVECVIGSPREPGTLEAAGLAGAKAVVCVERSELHTLETALFIRELRPDARVVLQLANMAVGSAVAQVTGPGSVLDVAALAAPSIVEACMGRHQHTLDLGGTRFVAAEVVAERATSLRRLYGDLAPVAVVPARGGPVEVCPGRDHRVGPGDRVVVLGTPEELSAVKLVAATTPVDEGDRADGAAGAAAGGDPGDAAPPKPRPAGVGRLPRQLLGALGGDADRALRRALLAVAVVVVVSTVVVRLGYRPSTGGHLTIVESLYFIVETISTVGFGDFSYAAQEQWLQIFAILLIVTGAALLTTTFALLTNLLVSRRIEASLGRRRVTGMHGHVVIVGLGAVGVRVLELLRAEGRDVVVIERDEGGRYLNQARALGSPVLIADATQRRTLDDANLSAASAVAVLTSDDLTNIETGLAVRAALGDRWRTMPVVLRVFDRRLGRQVEQHFGFRHVRSTSAIAAPWFVGAALGLTVLGSFTVEHEPFLVGRLTVAPGKGLDGMAMRDLSARIRVIALSRVADGGRLEHPPRRDTRFAPGDRAYLVGPYEELLVVLRHEQASGPVASEP